MTNQKPHSKRLSLVVRPLLYLPFAFFLFAISAITQRPGLPNLQPSTLSPRAFPEDAYAFPLLTNTPTITPTSPPLPCGLAWNVIDSLNPSPSSNDLFGVAPVSANDVWAVGGYCMPSPCYSMVQHWDGSRWTLVTSPNPGTSNNLLIGIAAV